MKLTQDPFQYGPDNLKNTTEEDVGATKMQKKGTQVSSSVQFPIQDSIVRIDQKVQKGTAER